MTALVMLIGLGEKRNEAHTRTLGTEMGCRRCRVPIWQRCNAERVIQVRPFTEMYSKRASRTDLS